jgi:uncharacterized protein YdcH (DUF465 family)
MQEHSKLVAERQRSIKMQRMKEQIQADMVENGKALQALPGKFSLSTGKMVTYTVEDRPWEKATYIKLQEVPVEGRWQDDLGYLNIKADGGIDHFSFSSICGRNTQDAEKARVYFQECAELISQAFIDKLTGDYKAKKAEFERLGNLHNSLRDEVYEIENQEREAQRIAKKLAQEDLLHHGQVWVEIGGGTTWRLKVESQTEKSVCFSEWRECEGGTWSKYGDRMVQKRTLGKLTEKSRGRSVGILPMGCTEFGEYPMDNKAINSLPNYTYEA